MKRILLILSILGASLTGFIACNEDNPVTNNGNTIEVGSYTSSGSVSVGGEGGVITVRSGSLNGMTITIPPGALSTARTFSISTAEVKRHTFGVDFNPLTPMIRIDNGGGYADSVMTLKIPLTVPAGHFAMGFYYDEETGEIEGIPVVAINDNEIILAARHFSGKHLSDGRKGGIQSSKTYVDVIVASMESAKLFGVQESGFRPGVDDWEFVNGGSYIATIGHCTGQSITAIWYYSVRKLGMKEPALNGRFDKIPGGLWQEDRDGYRFASVVWADQNTGRRDGWMDKFNSIGTKRFSHDSLHYLAFAYAIHLTQKPQLTEVWNANSGHAMIVYRANNRVLSIADPNFPNSSSHFITLGANGSFVPYESKLNANEPTELFPDITYVGKSALFSFEGITTRYSEMINKTIGDFPPNAFPAVDLLWYDGKDWVDLPDTLNTEVDTLLLAARCVSCFRHYGSNLTLLEQLTLDGKHVAYSDANGYLKVPLRSGDTLLPLYILGNPDNDNYWYFVDFKMPLIRKEKQAKFEYWLRGVDSDGDSSSFGSKDGSIGWAGSWSGTTFKVDTRKTVVEDGNTYLVGAKMTAVCNATRTMITSYNVEEWIEMGTQKAVLASLDGKNLPLTSTNGDNLIFSATGQASCSSLTRVDFDFWGKVERWFCDETSFIQFTIPKP